MEFRAHFSSVYSGLLITSAALPMIASVSEVSFIRSQTCFINLAGVIRREQTSLVSMKLSPNFFKYIVLPIIKHFLFYVTVPTKRWVVDIRPYARP